MQLFSFGLTMLAGLFVSQAFGYLVANLVGIDLDGLASGGFSKLTQEPGHEIELLLFQLTYAVVLFIISPLFYLSFINRRTSLEWLDKRPSAGQLAFMSVLIVVAYLPSSAYLVDWNANIRLPESLSALEEALQAQERALQELTAYFTNFNSIGHLLLAFLVIAIIPGIGEELVFRGLLQRFLTNLSKNPHVGIWVGAFLFSLFHWQFYGLVPRWILGALFGYLYFWSGRLIYPIIAHFTNNAVTLGLVFYLQQSKGDGLKGMENVSGEVSIWVALASVGVVLYFLKYFRGLNPAPAEQGTISGEDSEIRD